MSPISVPAIAYLCLGALATPLVTPPAVAQNVPLVQVPSQLPRGVRDSLAGARAVLESSIDSVDAEIRLFNARCGAVGPGMPGRDACERDIGPLGGRAAELRQQKQVFADAVSGAVRRMDEACPTIEERFRRDQEALRRQQAVNETAAAELDALARESEAAQRAAINLGVSSLFGEAASRLAQRAEQAKALARLVDRHEARLRGSGADVALVRAQIDRAERAYLAATAAAAAGRTAQRVGEVNAVLGLASAEAAAIERTAAAADGEARRLLSSSALQALLVESPEVAEFARAVADQVSATPQFERLAPVYGLAAFLVDYGYEATRWAAAADQIIARNQLTPQQLEAVAALRRQMVRTVELRAACQARR